MAQQTVTMTFEVRVAWWLRLYVAGVVLMSRATSLKPDEKKVQHWINKGVSVKIVSKP